MKSKPALEIVLITIWGSFMNFCDCMHSKKNYRIIVSDIAKESQVWRSFGAPAALSNLKCKKEIKNMGNHNSFHRNSWLNLNSQTSINKQFKLQFIYQREILNQIEVI